MGFFTYRSLLLNLLYVVVTLLILFLLAFFALKYAAKNLYVSQVRFVGVDDTLRKDLLNRVGYIQGQPLLSVNLAEVRACINKDPLVVDSAVKVVLPNQIMAKVVTANPLFVWQNAEDEFFLVDSADQIVRKATRGDYKRLILIKGKQLPFSTSDDLRFYLYSFPKLAKQVVYVSFEDSYWALHLQGGFNIYLPITGIAQSLNLIKKMENRYQLLERKIAYIDARVTNKLFIRPAPANEKN